MDRILIRAALVAVWATALDNLARAHYRADWAAGPVPANGLDVHDGDPRLDHVSAGTIVARIARLYRERDALCRLDLSGMSRRDRDDPLL